MAKPIVLTIHKQEYRAYLYMLILTTLVVVLGSVISYTFDWGLSGTGIFLIISGIINFVAYYFSDKIIIRISGCIPLKKELAPEVYEIVDRLSKKLKIPSPKIYLIKGDIMNAFATGRDIKHSSIALSKDLLTNLNKEEVEGVIAHELFHIRNYDMRLMAIVAVLVGFVSILADMFWRASVFSKNKDSSGTLAIVGMVLSIFTPITAFFIQLAISRKREFHADKSAAILTKNPKALANALRKISLDLRVPTNYNKSIAHLYFSTPTKSGFIDKLFSTHPPIEERIYILDNMKI